MDFDFDRTYSVEDTNFVALKACVAIVKTLSPDCAYFVADGAKLVLNCVAGDTTLNSNYWVPWNNPKAIALVDIPYTMESLRTWDTSPETDMFFPGNDHGDST